MNFLIVRTSKNLDLIVRETDAIRVSVLQHFVTIREMFSIIYDFCYIFMSRDYRSGNILRRSYNSAEIRETFEGSTVIQITSSVSSNIV